MLAFNPRPLYLQLIVYVLFTRDTIQLSESGSPTVHDANLEPEGLDKATPLKVFRSPSRVARTNKRASGALFAISDDFSISANGKSVSVS